MPVQIKFKRLSSEAKIPVYALPGDAGADICACSDAIIWPGQTIPVHTGIAVEIPDGYELQVRPRSSLGKRSITIANTPGTIDSGYRGELLVLLHNLGNVQYVVRAGDKIAQLVLAPVYRAEYVEAQELSESVRGEGGMGSTGK